MQGHVTWASRSSLLVAMALMTGSFSDLARGEGPQPPVRVAAVTDMELLPGGEFTMGEDGGDDNAPAHKVRLSAFYLDRHEVTNAQYFRFCQETGHAMPFFWGMHEFRASLDFPDHPVVGVSWDDARDYASWAGKRLPTEAEWEYAARGGLAGKRFPSGDDVDRKEANFSSRGSLRVASLKPNGYGLYDMAGNVREWVADLYDPRYYARSPVAGPKGPDQGTLAVVRGGGWVGGKMCVGVASRIALPTSWVDVAVGFRCARDAATPPAR
jgi:formylglycine-generating enzyme required for sulfatase activity